MALSQVVREVVLYLADELLGVFGVESEDLAESLQADILQVAVCQGLDVGVGLDHLLLCQGVGANQISFTCGQTQRHVYISKAVILKEYIFPICLHLRERDQQVKLVKSIKHRLSELQINKDRR